MKEKLALVIAALMISSMAFAISTTTVSADSATLTPTNARDATRIKFTVTVTNDTSDNIDNVRIITPTSSNFVQAIGGYSAAANLRLAADNIENAVAPLNKAGENLKLAGDNMAAVGQALIDAAAQFSIATDKFVILGWVNIPNLMDQAATYLDRAGDSMAAASDNFTGAADNLELAWYYLELVAGTGETPTENLENYNTYAADNLNNAAVWLDNVGDALLGGSLRRAGENLVMAGSYLENAGKTNSGLADNSTSLGVAVQTAGSKLQLAGNNMIAAANYENYAGINLALVGAHLENVGYYLEQADSDLIAAGDNLENAGLRIGDAATIMQASDDNIFQAGDNLSLAAENLAAAATRLGVALGGDELGYAKSHENAAAENLNVGGLDLGTAGDQLIAAATDLSAAASAMLLTANTLAPSTWTVTDATDYVDFSSIGDNVITPGGSETFVFLWTTPDISIDNTYTITIASNKEGGASANWIIQDTVTLTVDGSVPSLTTVVTQAGVVDNNVVGTTLDSAQATITITASEVLQTIGAVTVENSGNAENFLPPITMTTTDNIVYTGTFTVGVWDDNAVVVKVASAKDPSGLENLGIVARTVTVDTRAPIFIDNGLTTLVLNMGAKYQPGTGTTFLYVDNKVTQSLTVEVEDNSIGNADNDVNILSVTINDSSAVRSAVVQNLWSFDPLTLSEGLNSIVTVTATDRTGNTVSDNIENIFIDSLAPTIAFNTIAGESWTSGIRINDNTPEIKVTVVDPGYPTSGLGIARGKLVVRLDNDDNFLNDSGYENTISGFTLENKDEWDNGLAGVFENIIDNAGAGLSEGIYWITVAASDNLAHNGYDNQYDALSFIIDSTAPTSPTLDVTTVSKDIDDPLEVTKATRTITGFAEVGSTITVYGTVIASDPVETELGTDTVESDGKWSVTITLVEGETTRIQITATDVAGNESSRTLYGYLLLPIVVIPPVDTTEPTVTITSPEADTTTDATSILLEATVTKDTEETYSELAVRIDATSLMAPITATNALSTDGKMSRAVGLVEGTNTLSVSVMDASGNWSRVVMVTITRTVTPWGTYAIIIVIVALVLAAIAIFRKR